MTSILTNYGAMVALQNLQATQQSLLQTENQISSGMKVSTAKDDASAWTIATTMKSNIASLNQVSQSLGNADSILGTAVSGANQITSLVSQIRAKVASFTDTSSNQSATQAEVDQLINQIGATISSSNFNGQNLLDATAGGAAVAGGTGAGLTFVAATANDYTTTGAASATISTGTVTDLSSANTSTAAVKNFFALTTSGGGIAAAISGSSLDAVLKTVDAYSSTVNSAAATLGAVQQNVESQQTFVNSLTSTLQKGVSNMVDADMTTESAKLSALQTQQQLGTQALSIANQAPQSILKLFG